MTLFHSKVRKCLKSIKNDILLTLLNTGINKKKKKKKFRYTLCSRQFSSISMKSLFVHKMEIHITLKNEQTLKAEIQVLQHCETKV